MRKFLQKKRERKKQFQVKKNGFKQNVQVSFIVVARLGVRCACVNVHLKKKQDFFLMMPKCQHEIKCKAENGEREKNVISVAN